MTAIKEVLIGNYYGPGVKIDRRSRQGKDLVCRMKEMVKHEKIKGDEWDWVFSQKLGTMRFKDISFLLNPSEQ